MYWFLEAVCEAFTWLIGVEYEEFMTFNVEREFLSQFVHGLKTGESRNSLQVANLALRSQPWVAIFCKAPPARTNEKLFNEHHKEMIRVVECLQGTHGLVSAQECQWALHTPENTEGFVSGKIRAIARVGETSDMTVVAKQRLKAQLVSAEAAQQKYCELAGSAAVDLLRQTHATLNNGREPTRAHYINATITFLGKEGQNKKLQEK